MLSPVHQSTVSRTHGQQTAATTGADLLTIFTLLTCSGFNWCSVYCPAGNSSAGQVILCNLTSMNIINCKYFIYATTVVSDSNYVQTN